MKIRKAVVTAAKRSEHALPLQRLVDREGVERSALELILLEIMSAEIDHVCIVIVDGDEPHFRSAAGDFSGQLEFVSQAEPRGYADALWCARDFVGSDPFLHLVSDHLYLSRTDLTCAQQLVHLASQQNCSVTAVEQTREHRLPYFGAIGGRRVPQRNDLYEVTTILEKPTPTLAEQELVTAGLRSGHYLGVFGLHVLTPLVMSLIEELLATGQPQLPLSPALAMLAKRERYLALEVAGSRHDIGRKYGLLVAQLAHCLDGPDRDWILTELVQLLSDHQRADQR